MKKNNDFKPYIPADRVLPEFTWVSVILGILLAVIFGAANAYLGLRVGLTVSASIPAAVISMGIIRMVLKRDSILENNMVQTVGSAGESLAAGVIFTMPAIFMWATEGVCEEPTFITIALIALCGGVLGVLFMIPLRTALIVEEHGVLPYPEGTACAEVLLAGEKGGESSKAVFLGLGLAAIYKFIADGLKLFPSEIDFSIKTKSFTGGVGMDVLPALAGVGYICGYKISGYMAAGGIISYLVLIPAVAFFGGEGLSRVADASGNLLAFSALAPGQIWSNYIRYIGAGAVAAGGIMSLIKTFPSMVSAFREAIKGFGRNGDEAVRTQKDLPMKWVLAGVAAVIIVMVLLPAIPVGIGAAVMIAIFGFFFATVSSRMVGMVGSSNNPVSGMAIATLIIATALFKVTGMTGTEGMIAAIAVGTVICIVAAMAGDVSQDLKTGYIVGATPIKQQVGELIGTIVSALAIGGVMYLLNSAWGFGSAEIPAPQASLMKMVVEGVMGGELPWTLVIMGVFIAVAVEILGIPVLAFAIGLYLPIHLSLPIFAGGIVRKIIEEKKKYDDEEEKKSCVQKGVLYCSGMIAGEGVIGILLAVFAVFGINMDLSGIYGNAFETTGDVVGFIAFALIIASLVLVCKRKKAAK
ncbi:MAG: oligopeptide transporter, OPT family [Eubacteriales bacterium]|nr:oligopeptide transporter, OPT family [Eubacteriales bacterium]